MLRYEYLPSAHHALMREHYKYLQFYLCSLDILDVCCVMSVRRLDLDQVCDSDSVISTGIYTCEFTANLEWEFKASLYWRFAPSPLLRPTDIDISKASNELELPLKSLPKSLIADKCVCLNGYLHWYAHQIIINCFCPIIWCIIVIQLFPQCNLALNENYVSPCNQAVHIYQTIIASPPLSPPPMGINVNLCNNKAEFPLYVCLVWLIWQFAFWKIIWNIVYMRPNVFIATALLLHSIKHKFIILVPECHSN